MSTKTWSGGYLAVDDEPFPVIGAGVHNSKMEMGHTSSVAGSGSSRSHLRGSPLLPFHAILMRIPEAVVTRVSAYSY